MSKLIQISDNVFQKGLHVYKLNWDETYKNNPNTEYGNRLIIEERCKLPIFLGDIDANTETLWVGKYIGVYGLWELDIETAPDLSEECHPFLCMSLNEEPDEKAHRERLDAVAELFAGDKLAKIDVVALFE